MALRYPRTCRGHVGLYRWGKPKPPPATGIHRRALGTLRGTRSALIRTLSTARGVRRRRVGHGGMASYTESRAEMTYARRIWRTSA